MKSCTTLSGRICRPVLCSILHNRGTRIWYAAPAVQADGCEVDTVEGMTDSGELKALQDAFVARNALQCGYCTSGMLIAASELVAVKPGATREEVREWMSGNYCRCTGYQAIVDAVCDVLKQGNKEAGA